MWVELWYSVRRYFDLERTGNKDKEMLKRSGARAGFTLIELLITVSIIGVITAVGWGLVDDLLPRYRARQAALDFAAAVDMARTKAIFDGVEYRIWMVDFDNALGNADMANYGEYWIQAGNSSAGSSAWDTLPVDGNGDGFQSEGSVVISQGGEDAIPGVSIAQWDTISGPSSSSSTDCIVFSPRGWVTNQNSDFSDNGYITIEFVNKEAYAKGLTEIYYVRIARGGFARVDFSNSDAYSDVEENGLGLDYSSSTANESSGG